MHTSKLKRECINTNTKQDFRYPFLRHITILEIGGVLTIVATDNQNKCLKSFYTIDNKWCRSRLQLNDSPWDIAQLRDNTVMVVVPDSNHIATVEVTPDLFIVAHIYTNKKYYSLVVMPHSKLAAGSMDSVDILNMQGEVLKSVTTHNDVELFKNAHFLAVNNTGHLLVSDWGKNTVTCLTSEGEVVWIYLCDSGKGTPRGITTTDGGDILVVEYNSKKVIQLSDSGEYVQDILSSQDGLKCPDDVCVDKHGALYLCQYHELFVYKRK